MSEYEMTPELRLRDLARRALADYNAGRTSLRGLVDDLDAIWSNLEPSVWRDEFRGHWWTLEQVYAVALDRRELDALPEDAAAEVEEAIAALEKLLRF
jgi:hypothetical protein